MFLVNHFAIPTPPKFIAEFELPAGLIILEGVSASNKFGRGGGWQVFLESAIPDKHPHVIRSLGEF